MNATATGVGPASGSADWLAGKRVLVTGGARGIGRAVSAAMAAGGARVAMLQRDGAAMQATLAELGLVEGVSALAVPGSVTVAADVERVLDAMGEVFGGIDVLVNNAGVACVGDSLTLEESRWRDTVDTNLTGAFLCAQRAARRMLAVAVEDADVEAGCIVNVASIWGVLGAPQRAAYCASKAALLSLTRCLAVEWAARRLRVNAVNPGYTRTHMIDALIDEGRFDRPAIEARTPQQRMIEPEDVARSVLFLCSPAAARITGEVLTVDGGWTAYGYL